MAEGEIMKGMHNVKSERAVNGKKYKCIFFDLDHTLWDYETNSAETLFELYQTYNLLSKGIPLFENFLNRFKKVNIDLWNLYDKGLIDSDVIRRERFKQILEPFNAYDVKLSADLSRDYLDICPRKGKLMPHATDILNYLKQYYRLAVITNGFEEIQHQKLAAGSLRPYFDHVITSQKAGFKKPSREIFDCALQLNGVTNIEAVMVGDNLITDIGGAKNASIDAVFFNTEEIVHNESLHFEIRSLEELRAIL
jgi:YjjG family noncanonical pyrimidine nucleotidase